MENRGVIEPVIGEDYITGINSPIPFSVRLATRDWTPYFPDGVDQFDPLFDSQGCVSFSAEIESLEIQMNWMKATGQFTDTQIQEMMDLNYIQNGKFVFSKRFLAKMSGTTKQGNSQNVVAETLRKCGVVGETDYPFTPDLNWETFYAEIPQTIKDKALKIFNYVQIAYEWVVTDPNAYSDYQAVNAQISYHLQHAPLQFTAPLCPSYYAHDPIIKSCPLTTLQHAMTIGNLDPLHFVRIVFDHYKPYTKVFAADYPMPYILKIVVVAVVPPKKDIVITKTNPQVTVDVTDKTPAWKRIYFGLLKLLHIDYNETSNS